MEDFGSGRCLLLFLIDGVLGQIWGGSSNLCFSAPSALHRYKGQPESPVVSLDNQPENCRNLTATKADSGQLFLKRPVNNSLYIRAFWGTFQIKRLLDPLLD